MGVRWWNIGHARCCGKTSMQTTPGRAPHAVAIPNRQCGRSQGSKLTGKVAHNRTVGIRHSPLARIIARRHSVFLSIAYTDCVKRNKLYPQIRITEKNFK